MNTETNIETNIKTSIETNTKINTELETDQKLQQTYKREQQEIHASAELVARTKAAMETEAGRVFAERRRRIRLYRGFSVVAAVCAVCLIALPYIGDTILGQEALFGRGGASGKAESPMMAGSAADVGGQEPVDAGGEDTIAAAEAGSDEMELLEEQEMTETGGVDGLFTETLDEQPENFTVKETITLAGKQVHLGKDENGEWMAVTEQAEGVLVLSGPGMSRREFVSEVREYLEGK